jgi:selenocysteine lyase/cysteine desulfurase
MRAAWRDEFPITEQCVYFDHAGVAPVSRRVAAAVDVFVRDARDFARLHYHAWETRAEAVRSAAAALIGAHADEMAFVASTSDGLSAIATGVNWRAGDSLVIVADEFPANVYPWWDLERFGVTIRTAPIENGRLTVEAVANLIDDSTRVVSVSAVDFATGQRRPLAALGDLCRARGILFCVDAIQALGALRLDVERDRIDCLAADGHKWMCAPEGCGILYVSRSWVERLTPRRLGWKSVVDHGTYLPYHFELKPDALRFECGSLNFLGIHALGAALDLLAEAGADFVEERVLGLTGQLRDGLVARGYSVLSPDLPRERSGILTVRCRRDPVEVVAALRARGILANARGGGVRLSPHFYCDDEDVARCLEAFEAANG